MNAQWFGPIQSQTRIFVQLSRRETLKRWAACLAIVAVLAWQDHAGLAKALGAFFVVLELFLVPARRLIPHDPEKITLGGVLTLSGLNILLLLGHLLPAVLFCADGSTALLVASLIWMLGVIIHVGNTTSSLPFYHFGLILPSLGTGGYMLWLISNTGYHGSDRYEWAFATVLLLLFAGNSVQTLSLQKDTEVALQFAQSEANARLRALEYLSDHDSLTGLLNRRAFDSQLGRLLARRTGKKKVAVFLVDLDGFKPINDTYSHSAGDHVLQEISRRLAELAGDDGLVGRLGGDEFILAYHEVSTERAAYRIARKIKLTVEAPIPFGEKTLQVGTSIGLSLSRGRADRVSTLCSEADQAMYRAKVSPGRKITLFRPELFPPRPTLEDKLELVAAFKGRQILPYYQPKVSIETGSSIGFEALARWAHPERGLLPPSEFIPRINQLGLQADFLLHMTDCVLTDIETLVAEGLNPGEVSVNVPEVTLATLSGRQDLDRLLAAHPTILKHLTLEMTEDVLITRAADLIRDSVAHFRKRGLRVSLDDFGTGFASFHHLGQLEFDELKIDPSFVADLCVSHTTDVLMAGLLNMAKGLGVDVIVEGVETTAQLDRLRALGCTRVQGYLFGQAMPLTETRIRLFAEQEWAAGRAAQ